MNISTDLKHSGGRFRWKSLAAFVTAGLVLGGLTGCHTTPPAEIGENNFSGFLGNYSQLQQGGENEASFIYIDRKANWGKYTKIYLRPIEVWQSAGTNSALGNLSPQNQQMLANFFQTALVTSLSKNYEIVNYAGPDVLVVHAALTDASESRPVGNLASRTVSTNLVAGFEKQTITGTGRELGSVLVEAEFLDGQTGQRLASVVDARAGAQALHLEKGSTWGDVMQAFNWWAQKLDKRLARLQAGIFSAKPL
jgi:hypothetical protein